MAFTPLVKGTLISHTEVNDNFSFIHEGSLIPRAGASLAATDNTSDLGAVAATWNNVHAQNIDIQGSITNTLKVIAEVTLSATAIEIEVTGLDGDTDEIYQFIFNASSDTTANFTPTININQDSGTNYGNQIFQALGGVAVASRAVNQKFWLFGTLRGSTTVTLVKGIMYAKSGNERTMLSLQIDPAATQVNAMQEKSHIWNNTSSTITSIRIGSSARFDIGTNFQIWAKR